MQTIIEYFANHHDAIWYVAGGIMLIVEAKILGLSTGILLFTGLGAMLTGFAVSVGWVVETEMQIIAFGILVEEIDSKTKALRKAKKLAKENKMDYLYFLDDVVKVD